MGSLTVFPLEELTDNISRTQPDDEFIKDAKIFNNLPEAKAYLISLYYEKVIQVEQLKLRDIT